MMIQIEYPALARRNPTTDRRAQSDGPVRRTQQNRKEGPKPKPKEHGARALARSPSPTSARRPTDVPPSPSPPSPTASANQRSAANAERRHSAATIAVVRRPKYDRRGEATALSCAAAAKWKPKMVSIPTVSQSALVSSAEGKCLPAYLSSQVLNNQAKGLHC